MDLYDVYKIDVPVTRNTVQIYKACLGRVLQISARPWRYASLQVIASEEAALCNRGVTLVRYKRDGFVKRRGVCTGEMQEDLYSDKPFPTVVCYRPQLVPLEELPLYLYMYDTAAYRRLLTGETKTV